MKKRLIISYSKLKETNILSNFFNLSGIQLSNILLLMLIIPLVTRAVGIAEFGVIMFASRFSQLAGTVINFGTSQSAIRDVAFNLEDKTKLSEVFYNTLYIRLIMFVLYLTFLIFFKWAAIPYFTYILLSLPIVLAEIFNPLCFFIGTERLKIFNLYNMLSNIVCILALVILIKHPHNAGWVNFILGISNTITYTGLLIFFCKTYQLQSITPVMMSLLKLTKNNFYLTVNNISVNLQQSVIIFALPAWGNTNLLGAYTLCDRIIGQCRNLLITISNAIYPNAAHLYKESTLAWDIYRKKTKLLLACVFLVGGIILFILADLIIFLLSKEYNPTAILFLKIMAFVPAVSALNVLNVLDQLLKNNTVNIFRIAVILFVISIAVSFLLLNLNHMLLGSFTLVLELSALAMYEFVITKPSVQYV